MSHEKLQWQLTDYAASVGMDNIQLDKNGYCCLNFKEDLLLNIQWHKNSERVVFYIHCGVLTEDGNIEIYRDLLGANLFWQDSGGATLAVDKESNEVWLMDKKLLASFDNVNDFSRYITSIVNIAEQWQRRLTSQSKVSSIGYRNNLLSKTAPHWAFA
ncbi:type III secretion system chaperone [uncultured Shewanella sp.]|uniref:type III secretion system chaperone n=1 Tax=uncultured Shewanella sp. TaxID=173975 RepID=UPI00261D2C76|nr:type III secretion system chaperone [uncultured Shewanella sp.]